MSGREGESSCDQPDKEGAELTRTAVVGRQVGSKCRQRLHRKRKHSTAQSWNSKSVSGLESGIVVAMGGYRNRASGRQRYIMKALLSEIAERKSNLHLLFVAVSDRPQAARDDDATL